MFNTPILFLIFNRPKCTEIVFNTIRNIQPKKLYIAADGPRDNFPEDIFKCKITRKIALNIDWACKVHTRFRENNLGCGRAISDAISWFFKQEESGIILEDDCVPCESFFLFCKELLEKYKDHERIMHINGNNFNVPISKFFKNRNLYSYYFGSFAQVWGWASWRRAWEKYDYNISSWKNKKMRRTLFNRFPNIGTYLERALCFDMVYRGTSDIWDYQWQYAVLANEGFVIIPTNNLVSNIGYGSDSTHIKSFDKRRNSLVTKNIDFPLKHSLEITKMKKLDYFYSLNMGMKPSIKKVHKYLLSYIKSFA